MATDQNARVQNLKETGYTKLVIGKIPGYNNNIQKSGGIQYQDRLLNNLTSVSLIPTGYSINFEEVSDLVSLTAGSDQNLYHIGNNLQSPGITDAVGVTLNNALTNWKKLLLSQSKIPKYQSFLTGNNNSTDVQELQILCTNDSTMSEVFSNSFEMSTSEEMAGKFANWTGADKIAALKKAVTIDSNAGLAMLSTASDLGGNNQLINLISSKALGIQTALPEEWKSSDYNNTLQLMVKLVSPSGDEDSIANYILKPLLFLILATAPITIDGLGFGYPMLWQVKADGLMDMEIAGISALTITRGGAETQFNQHNQPLNIDVRLTISPLVKGFASAMSKNSGGTIESYAKDGENIYSKIIASSPNLLARSFDNNDNGNYHKTIKL